MGSEKVRSKLPDVRSRRWMLADLSKPTSFLPEMRIVLSLASIWRSTLSTPGSSTIATKSSSCWKTLIGGKAPVPAVLLPNQSLWCCASSARCNAKIASNGLLKLIGMGLTSPRRLPGALLE